MILLPTGMEYWHILAYDGRRRGDKTEWQGR